MALAEAVLYNDDSLCVRYQDGSVLHLAPCASAFRYHEKQSSSYLQRPYFQQLTRFTVSTLKSKVASAVLLRNQYASRPYLCKELLDQDLINVQHSEVSECTWPKTLSSEYTIQNSNGSITVKSLDGYASLTLNQNKQTFSVSYWAQISQDEKQQAQHLTQRLHSWVHTADQSIQNCPECWSYPLKIALTKRDDGKIHDSQEMLTLCNVSKLPTTLPVNCHGAHLHKWMLRDQVFSGNQKDEVFWQPNIKMVWKNNTTYRVYQNREKMLTIEIHPGDGTIFISSGLTGKFFNHYGTENTEDKMYTADKPPPDRPHMQYSMAKILRQGSRLFNFIMHVSLHACSQSSSACWQFKCGPKQEYTPQKDPPNITETATVPGVGKFVAYSHGHLYISFADRTLLNVKYEPRICKKDLWFNCTLPDGHVVQGNVDNLLGLERYIKMACEWGEWVNTSPQKRETFYKDTIWDPDNQRIVEAEIGKLRRFNYILDHGTPNHKLSQAVVTTHTLHKMNQEIASHQQEDLVYPQSHADVTKALQQTSSAIKNIENFLVNSKQT